MTEEEAKKEIIDMANTLQLIPNTPKGKAVSMALKALEQEPCEDAIDRAKLLQRSVISVPFHLSDGSVNYNDMVFAADICRAKPVYPQPKTGRWIDDKCSVCGKGIEDLIDSCEWYKLEEPKFCPFCGAKIQEVKG